MNLKSPKWLLFLLVSLSLIGCDKVCRKTVEDLAYVQNLTNRSMNLKVCKGRSYGETDLQVGVERTMTEYSLGSRIETEVRGGPTASCSDVSGGKVTMALALAPASFGTAKLCYDQINQSHVIVENHQSCPTGFQEQTTSAPCVNSQP